MDNYILVLVFFVSLILSNINIKVSSFCVGIKDFFIALVILGLWVYLSGAFNGVCINEDWLVRYAVLRDLYNYSWPVVYADVGYYLRAPIGYYLPAALFGKLTGAYSYANLFFGLYTLCLLTLTYVLVSSQMQIYKWWHIWVFLLLLIFFSGLDVVGYLITHRKFELGNHIEWWAGREQYSSMTTLLFWAPNHSILIWVATALLLKAKEYILLLRNFHFIIACISIVSPFGVVGLSVLYAFEVFVAREKVLNKAFFLGLLGSLILVSYVVRYITYDASSLVWPSANKYSWFLEIARYIAFIFLEFAIYFGVILLFKTKVSSILWASIFYLILIPMMPSYGPGNDFAMRSTIAPLFVLMVAVYNFLISDEVLFKIKMGALLVFLVGSITPISEFYHVINSPSVEGASYGNLYEVTKGEAHHYYAKCNGVGFVRCN